MTEKTQKIYHEVVVVSEFEKDPLAYLEWCCGIDKEITLRRYRELDKARTGDEFSEEWGCFVSRSGDPQGEFQQFMDSIRDDISIYLDNVLLESTTFFYSDDEEMETLQDLIVGIMFDKVEQKLKQIAVEER